MGQKYLVNPLLRPLAAAGLIPGAVVLETKGRKSGRPHRNPVGGRLEGDTFWWVSEHGRFADYVRNIQADPKVRLRIGRRWRSGTAHLMPDDDTRERLRKLRRPLNSTALRLAATERMTVRVDLDG